MIPRSMVRMVALLAVLVLAACTSQGREPKEGPPAASVPTDSMTFQPLPPSDAERSSSLPLSGAVVLTVVNECDGACCAELRDVPTLIAYADGAVLMPDPCSNLVNESWIDPKWLLASVSTYFNSAEAQITIRDVGGANTPGFDVADGGSEILTFYPESGAPMQSRGHVLGIEDQNPQYFPADQLLARRALRAELESIRAAVSTPVRWDPEFVTIRKVNTADISWEVVNTWPSSATAELRAFLQADGFCLQSSNADVVALLKSPEFRPAASLWTIDGDQVALELHPVLPGYSAC